MKSSKLAEVKVKSNKKAEANSESHRATELLQTRAAGVLLHLSSLPSPFGIGDLGKNAFAFADWLQQSGFSIWQVLPLVPYGIGNSPYASWSAFAGNSLFIDLEWCHEHKLLKKSDLEGPIFPNDQVDFSGVMSFKLPLLIAAAKTFLKSKAHPLKGKYAHFCQEQSWIDEAVLFKLIHEKQGQIPWWDWPKPLRDRQKKALEAFRLEYADELEEQRAIQFFFEEQWSVLVEYCHEKGIALVGDVPIYVAHDSADVWAHKEFFYLEEDGSPTVVSGVPPDAFSQLGQRWGTPIFNWQAMEKDNFSWWKQRLARAFSQTDVVRIDHFRGFSAYWEIPGKDLDASGGKWVQGPGQTFFDSLKKHFDVLPLVAEDLGLIDDDVINLRQSNKFPGMLILEFAFGDRVNHEYLPHSHERNRVVYPGTHDNETLVGWWHNLSENSRENVRDYFGVQTDALGIGQLMMRTALASVAHWAIISMQDLLGLDNSARMNDPKTWGGSNWAWRLKPKETGEFFSKKVANWLYIFNRKNAFSQFFVKK